MELTQRVRNALERAGELHDRQYRKDPPSIPYIVHPVQVMLIVSDQTNDEDVLVAALLHDVLEDVADYSEQKMRSEFGDRVVDIIKGVTENKDPNRPDEEPPWRELKQQYMDNLKTAPDESVLIAAADKLQNLWSLNDTYQRLGEETWNVFNSTEEDRLWYFESVIAVIEKRLDGELVDKLHTEFNNLREMVTQSS